MKQKALDYIVQRFFRVQKRFSQENAGIFLCIPLPVIPLFIDK